MRSRLCVVLAIAACDTSSAPPQLDGLPPMTLQEELRIGYDDDPDIGFSRIDALDVADDGTVHAFDGHAMVVRAFDSNGRRLASFGRRGKGPGEFSGVSAIGVLGDTVWTLDRSNARITFFSRRGKFLGSVPARATPVGDPALGLTVTPGRPLRDGRILGNVHVGGNHADPGPDTTRAPRLVFDRRGAVVDTAGTEHVHIVRLRRVTAGGSTAHIMSRVFERDPIELDADTLRIVVEQPPPDSDAEARLTVSRLDDYDVPTWTRTYTYFPRRLDAARRDATVAEYAELFFARAPREEAERAVRDVLEFPEYMPFAEGGMLGRDGTLWLLTGEPGTRGYWVVIAADGTPVGTVTLPPLRGARVMTFTRDRVWLAVEDNAGIPYVGRFGIVPRGLTADELGPLAAGAASPLPARTSAATGSGDRTVHLSR